MSARVVILCAFGKCGKAATVAQVTTSPRRVQTTPMCDDHVARFRRVGGDQPHGTFKVGAFRGTPFVTIVRPITDDDRCGVVLS